MNDHVSVFDTTLQETNIWLKAVAIELPPCDRQEAYEALRAVLHVLRDQLPTQAVLALSAQLPMLLRGVFLEGWRMREDAKPDRTPEGLADEVARSLPRGFPRRPNEAMEAVFTVLADRLDPGEARKLFDQLPRALKAAWPYAF